MNRMDSLERQMRKRLRILLSCFSLAAVVILVVLLLRFPHRYTPVNGQGAEQFVALCYRGVSLDGGDGTVTPEVLRKQLSALHNRGYVTIDSAQVARFMAGEDCLPPKALYLTFANDSKQTLLFADQELRKRNYQAALLAPGSDSDWDLQTVPKKQRAQYMRSGYWAENSADFAQGSGINRRGEPLTWRMAENTSAGQLLYYLGESQMDGSVSAYEWNCSAGQIDDDGAAVRLTSLYGAPGQARLLAGETYGEWTAVLRFPEGGDEIRRIYLRADSELQNYVCLRYEGGILTGSESVAGVETVLFTTPAGKQSIEMMLRGTEWKLTQNGTVLAWVGTRVAPTGYTLIEVEPPTENQVSEGAFVMTLNRPVSLGDRQVYTTVRSARGLWLHVQYAWETTWDHLRVLL